ncbi:hypothetical protein scyTo_0015993, partial [Scyliorhinus torazame]|nr:hypothetical protein [Scyliorhinus torazame]
HLSTSMQIVTWNVGTAVPPDDVTSLLGLNSVDARIDMYVIGLQEVNSMINKRLKDAIFTDQWSELFMDTLSPFGYVLGNKGGVSARLSLCGHMICFLNCHLPAHMENSDQRMDNFESILQLQQFNGPVASGVLDHDIVFWFGDLNFRIEQYDIRFVKSAIERNKLGLLWEKDQKRKPAWTDRILWRVKMSDCYDLSVNTTLLARSESLDNKNRHIEVLQHVYRSHMEYLISDHKPVTATFSLKFSHKMQNPLIQLQVEDEWNKPSDAVVRYRVASSFAKSSWDWLGLYRVGFRHHKDYVTYVWAKHDEADAMKQCYQVVFNEESVPKGIGEYILCYYSNNSNTIVGVTEPFQIILPSTSSDSSKSDSSESSSDGEEMSTLKLIRPKSRSPSPGKTKKRLSRSRSKSPAAPITRSLQGLNLTVSSKHKSKSRSPSPRGAQVSIPKQLKLPGGKTTAGHDQNSASNLTGTLSPSALSTFKNPATWGKDQIPDAGAATIGRPSSQAQELRVQPRDIQQNESPHLSPKLFQSPPQHGAVANQLSTGKSRQSVQVQVSASLPPTWQ